MKYVDERGKKVLKLLDVQKGKLPSFCNAFFLGRSHTTQPLTMLNYAYDLGVFFDFLTTEVADFVGKKPSELTLDDIEKIETRDIELFTHMLTATNKERAKARKLSCLRSFFKYLFKNGGITRNILPNVDLPKLHSKNIVRLDKDESRDIVAVTTSGEGLTVGQKRFMNKNGFRDRVILTFFLSTGVRVSELVGLNVGDIDLKNSLFKVTRKGGNETILYMTNELRALLQEYLERTHNVNGSKGNPLFPANAPLFVGADNKTRLGVRSVQNLVKKYALSATPLKNISPHKLRSTFGTNLYHATGDIYAVADVLGHQNVNTTRKHYAQMSEEIKKEAIKKFENADKA